MKRGNQNLQSYRKLRAIERSAVPLEEKLVFCEAMTRVEVATVLGITREAVRLAELSALRKLRARSYMFAGFMEELV